ncbi:MAG: hypothetical protein K0S42_1816 [Microvirga sp.]|jgi:hypothetical protein|nr:hypothetical protein [Microvirga sp.]
MIAFLIGTVGIYGPHLTATLRVRAGQCGRTIFHRPLKLSGDWQILIGHWGTSAVLTQVGQAVS